MNVIAQAINISAHGRNCANKIYSAIPARKTHFDRTLLLTTNKKFAMSKSNKKECQEGQRDDIPPGETFEFGTF